MNFINEHKHHYSVQISEQFSEKTKQILHYSSCSFLQIIFSDDLAGVTNRDHISINIIFNNTNMSNMFLSAEEYKDVQSVALTYL